MCEAKNSNCGTINWWLDLSSARTATISLRAKITLELVTPLEFMISHNEKIISGQFHIRVK